LAKYHDNINGCLLNTFLLSLNCNLIKADKNNFFFTNVLFQNQKIFRFTTFKDAIPLFKSVVKFVVAIKVILLPPVKKWRYFATPCLWKREKRRGMKA